MTPHANPVVEPRVWSRQTQCALAALLIVVLGLLTWAAMQSAQQRPLELQKAGTWQRIDLNEADHEQLRALPGLDDTLARRIIEHRESKGRFQSVDELDQIKGIGTVTLARVRPYLTVKAVAPEKNETVQVALRTSSSDPPRNKGKELPAEPLDLNTATLEQLQKLPGIGPVLAQRIIAAREQTPFRSVEDLLRVKGIGDTILKNIRPHIKVVDRGT